MSEQPENLPDHSTESTASEGKRLRRLGDFELRKKLGRGGMGEVYLARQVSLERLVALKTLSSKFSGQKDFVQRFHREARSMARLDHPNVVRVFAVDCQRGIHFAAIEYVDGQSVQRWLETLGRLEIADAVHLALVCAEALRHAHSMNMVHRDVKPDNILITRRGQAKLADFGLAKALDEDVSMTQSGTGMGTPLYMAPEQARNAKHVDGRSDIYALGATLYHLITGQLPFTGSSTLELVMAKEKGFYPAARSLRPEIPERLDLIIDKMMAKNTAHRYRDCEELIVDLASLAIHNSSLSFIHDAESFAVIRTGSVSDPAAASRVGSRTEPLQGTGGGGAATTMTDSRRTPARVRAKGPGSASGSGSGSASGSGVPSRTWFVQSADRNGKTLVEKISTARILKRIAAGTLTSDARAKVSADGNYVPLAQFPEFSDALLRQGSAQTTALKKKDMDRLYAKVIRAEARRHKWRSVRNLFQGFLGWTSLVLWLSGVGLLGWLGYQYGGSAVRDAATALGIEQISDVAISPEPRTGNIALELPE